MEKYGDQDLVDDLVARKTEANLFVSNPDFPNNQDLNPHLDIYMLDGIPAQDGIIIFPNSNW